MTKYSRIAISAVIIGYGETIQIKPSVLMLPVYGWKPSEKALEAKIVEMAPLIHALRFQGSGKSVSDIETYLRVLRFVSDQSDQTTEVVQEPTKEFYVTMSWQYEDFARVLGDFIEQNEESIVKSVDTDMKQRSFYGICSPVGPVTVAHLSLPLPDKLPLIVHRDDEDSVKRQVARLIYEHLELLGVRVAMKMSQEFSRPDREGSIAHESVRVSKAIRELMKAVDGVSVPVTSYMLLPVPNDPISVTGREDCKPHAMRLSYVVYRDLAIAWVEQASGVTLDHHMVSEEAVEKFVS